MLSCAARQRGPYKSGAGGAVLALRGGADIAPEYREVLQGNNPTERGAAVGSIDRDDVGASLPWPEGSEGKRASFSNYQREYKQLKIDVQSTSNKQQMADQQQKIHRITLRAMKLTPDDAAAYIPHGRMFLRKNVAPLREQLEYQSEKVLEETICELGDMKDEEDKRLRALEKSMQELLNNVFRGRFQLFMDYPGA